MRSEKLNIKSNIISRLEVPLSAFCAAPFPQPVCGWVVDCEGSGARIRLLVNGVEIPYEKVSRPDLENGYDTVPPSRIFAFHASAQVPLDAGRAVIEVVADLPDGGSLGLLEASFPVVSVDVAIAELFRDVGLLMKPEEFSIPRDAEFTATFLLDSAAPAPNAPALVLAKYRELLLATANKHVLFLSIFDYAANHLSNIAVSQLDLPRLEAGYLRAVSRWLAAWADASGRIVLTGPVAESLRPLLGQIFPRARIEDAGAGAAETPAPVIAADLLAAEWPVYRDEHPIFVVGAGRSGTSAATRILSQGEYPSFREGHVFPYLEQQLQMIAETWLPLEQLAAERGWPVPQRSVFERPLVEMVAHAAKKNPAVDRWVDKTPDARMLEVIPHLRRLYPKAQYLFLRRHPLKLAESRSRKFHEPLETALAQWAKCERLWAEHRGTLPDRAWIECDQADFSLRTGPTVRALIEFLRPTEPQQRNMIRAARMDRPENTLRLGGDGISDRRDFLYRQLLDMLPVSLAGMKWPPAAVEFYDRECRALAESLGYASEPSVERIKRDIRDVSTEIHEAEQWLISRACEQVVRPPDGIANTGRQFLGALAKRLSSLSLKS